MFLNGIRMTIKCLQSSNQRANPVSSMTRIQNYSDWFHRRPKRIVNEEEIIEYAEAADGPNEFLESAKEKSTHAPLKIRTKKRQAKKKVRAAPTDTKLKEDGSLNFIELKENDHMLTSLMMTVRSRKTRERNSRIILEGVRLINDAIDAGLKPEIILFSRNADVMKLPLPDTGIKLFKVPYRMIQTWSTLVTPPGLMAFFMMPESEMHTPAPDSLPVTIICDNVRDPGNLGSILRAAAAVGCKKLITLTGCVDIWNPKVLKTAAGAHFRMPIFDSKTWDEISGLIDSFANVYVADHNTSVEELQASEDDLEESKEENLEAELKSEEKNLKAELKSQEKDLEAELKSQQKDLEAELKSQEENLDTQLKNQDENLESQVEDEKENDDDQIKDQEIKVKKNVRKSGEPSKYEVNLAKEMIKNIPVIPYYATDYTEDEIVLVVGGETEGLSIEAINMINSKLGVRVNIPMTNRVESLNSSMALGIIAFEIKRQFALKAAKQATNQTPDDKNND